MVSEIERLRAELAAAELELKIAEDREFCTPENVRAVLLNIASANGGLNQPDQDLPLAQLADKIIVAVRKTHKDYQGGLWPEGNSVQRRGC